MFSEDDMRQFFSKASSAAPSYIERHALYPPPIVGQLACTFTGFDVKDNEIQAETDVHWEWRFAHTCANGYRIQGATTHTKPAGWIVYKKIGVLPPRAHVNACVLALISDRLVSMRACVLFF